MATRSLLVLALTVSCLQAGITAQQVVDRIESKLGIPPQTQTVDTFKAGDPQTTVTGVAVTMMATYDVLERAAKEGDNLVITHEPTFYGHLDQTAQLEQRRDQVLLAKQQFIRDHHLVVWRFHDGWHARAPDGIRVGMVKALGWGSYQQGDTSPLFVMPPTSLRVLAEQVKTRLGIHVIRLVGDERMVVTKIGLMPGAAGSARHFELLEQDAVELLVIGEAPEWETVEYVADAVSEGKKKALLILGHIPSEQEGMRECATWLATVVPEVRVSFVPAVEPFRTAK